jgi:hypothetical protein
MILRRSRSPSATYVPNDRPATVSACSWYRQERADEVLAWLAVTHRPAEKTAAAFATGPVLVVVALKCVLEVAVGGRYGWHRDELYYAVAGLHLQAAMSSSRR